MTLDIKASLKSEAVTALIQVFRTLAPQLNLAMIDWEGEVIASTTDWPDEAVRAVLAEAEASGWYDLPGESRLMEAANTRIYPLYGGERFVGVLAATGIVPEAARIEYALHCSLSLLFMQSATMSDHTNLLRAAQTRSKQLETIMEITHELSSTLDLEKLLKLIMTSAVDILQAGSGSLFLIDDETNDLVFRVVTSGEQHLIGMHVPVGKGIVGTVASTGEPLIVTNVEGDQRFFNKLDHSGFVTKSLLAVPLRVPDRLIGVVELINKVDGTDFDEEDSALLTTFAAQAAIAIENARLYQETLQKQRLEQELQLAFKVQSSLIPRRVPDVKGWDFAAWWQPAREVSGDFYDFVARDSNLGIVIADVSDKGMHAALFMALSRSIVRATTVTARTPAEGLTNANRLVCADSTGGMFVTLFYAQIDPVTSQVTYVNCGHNPPLWYRRAGQEMVELKRTAMMMGFDDTMECQQKSITMAEGDLIIFYTDGVTEAFNASNEQFGEERLHAVIRSNSERSASHLLAAIQRELKSFTGATPQSDDVTLVVAKRNPDR